MIADRHMPLCLEIEHHSVHNENIACILRVVPNSRMDPTVRLWLPHVLPTVARGDRARKIQLVYTEPLMFLDEELRCFVRFLDINLAHQDNASVKHAIDKYLKPEASEDCLANPYAKRLAGKLLRAKQHYRPSGEVDAAQEMRSHLMKLSQDIDPHSSVEIKEVLSLRLSLPDILAHDGNTVLFGNARTNTLIAELQGKLAEQHGMPFSLAERSVINNHTGASAYADEVSNGETFHCLISRWQTESNIITMFAGNNGRAVSATMKLLTSKLVSSVFQNRYFAESPLAPRLFQMVCSVRPADALHTAVEPAKIESVWASQ